MCIKSWDKTGGQVARGPAGVQRYSAFFDGSTFETGGMHSHVFEFVEVQHGS